MSLKLTDTFKGITVPDATITIDGIVLSADHITMTLTVSFKASPTSEIYNTKYLSCSYNIEGGDIVSQGYAYLKTLDAFAGAVES